MPGGRLILEMAYNKDDGIDHTKHIKKFNLRLYSGEEMKKLLINSGFSNIVVDYFKGSWKPFIGDVVPKGMIVKAIKKKS